MPEGRKEEDRTEVSSVVSIERQWAQIKIQEIPPKHKKILLCGEVS